MISFKFYITLILLMVSSANKINGQEHHRNPLELKMPDKNLKLYSLLSASLYSELNKTDLGTKNFCSLFAARFRISKKKGIIDFTMNSATPAYIENSIRHAFESLINYPDFLNLNLSGLYTGYFVLSILISFNENIMKSLLVNHLRARF